MLHFLALSQARELGRAGAVLPIFVPLAAYDDLLGATGHADIPLAEFLAHLLRKMAESARPASPVSRGLERGPSARVAGRFGRSAGCGRLRQYVAEQAGGLINQWTPRGNRFAITSRIVGYREARLPGNLPHVTVLDFGRPEIEALRESVVAAPTKSGRPGKETPAALQKAARRAQAACWMTCTVIESVERLAATPLLLTMLALLAAPSGQVTRSTDRAL